MDPEADAFQKQTSVYSEISRKSDQESLVDPGNLSRQCTEIDEIANRTRLDQALIEAALRDAVQECTFCVSIADPQREHCPLIAVSDEFLTMTGYLREEVVGKNCRFLNRNCYLESSTVNGLRHACNTGDAFTGVILNRRKSGELFMNLINLQGLVIARNPRGDALWFLVGIQADVTHVSSEKLPQQLPKLHEAAQMIRQKLTSELTTLVVASAMVAETAIVQPGTSWWLLPDPIYTAQESAAVPLRQMLFDTVLESDLTGSTDVSDNELESFRFRIESSSERLSSFARQQSQQVESLLPEAMASTCIDEALRAAVQDCNFCVSIGDPRADDCPLVAVSDEFEVLTGYSREEIIGKNCRFLGRNCQLGQKDQRALREACLNGRPFSKIIVNRRKSGDLFLNFLDLRGVTVAKNLKTREALWFVVGIQADVTHFQGNLPKNHLESIHHVASSIRAHLANQLSLMALAGSSTAGCLSCASAEVLWVPDSPRWMESDKEGKAPDKMPLRPTSGRCKASQSYQSSERYASKAGDTGGLKLALKEIWHLPHFLELVMKHLENDCWFWNRGSLS
ncbi:Phototropin-2 (Defective in chloroplast avoidance protein 1) (Non-phototropic hypocotyl 1-like protein 1) (AtKin7) (NPH1-like protein 1) [Durusdinium trenchii]|uniref:Phototropin-2 (Defective in chloroplast avoidance protein 1) (Non-phototropic hypocotyl 1-like protein 1) (AtKin7) (NPH1-like protein 1) n=1 Tax=Durusdinium trenchii TaxID=1381693 RepID=A0ABP0H997_9DINO